MNAKKVGLIANDLRPSVAGAIPIVHVLLIVEKFCNILELPRGAKSALTRSRMEMLTQHPNVTLEGKGGGRDQTLKVRNEGAILRFVIVDEATDRKPYRPTAIMFHRVLPKGSAAEPLSVYWSAGEQRGVCTPFSALELNGPTLQITDTLLPFRGVGERGTSCQFKFSIVIQQHRTGEVGVIDPLIENDYFENDNDTL